MLLNNGFNKHRRELLERGLTEAPGLIDAHKVRHARQLICALAESHGLLGESGWTKSDSRFSDIKPFRNALKSLTRSASFPTLLDNKIITLAEALIGEAVTSMAPGQKILFTLPETVDWCVPADVWHVDMPRLEDPGAPGVQAFTFLDEVKPKAGGTLVLTGSHQLMNASGFVRSKDLKAALHEKPYFQSLFHKERAPITDLRETKGRSDGTTLEVVELTGEPGDVFFMDLRALHTPAPNASDAARLMLTCHLPKVSVAPKISGIATVRS